MHASHQIADRPQEVGLDPAKVEELFKRAEREVSEGLLPSCQIAIARNGKVGAIKTFGRATQGGVEKPATDETLYCVFSCTKAIMSSAIWILLGEGKLEIGERAADIVPEFGTNGKESITVEQLLLHVAGFPNAPFPQPDWNSREKRLERFKSWRLEFPVGERFVYHPTAGFWMLGEIIERRTGNDFRDFVRDRIAHPLGLPELRLGLPRAEHGRVADLVWVGQNLTPEDYQKMGIPPPSAKMTVKRIDPPMPYRKLRRPPRKSASQPLGNLPRAYASTPQEAIAPSCTVAVFAGMPRAPIS